ncbi:hypothetical protein O6H91_06G116900 [Diphasiastrum complanatum]|uniref:Uncharacterized protein n=2 Tax=Diphasiastrum complanatum TaxID=34168 RepID=A0ACC2DI83_DIPCM|nr:hypothetical protein O6H91_06G116900 [Diphasiastrum complanatum]
MWPDLIAKAKAGGVDVIQTYVFWNVHEASRRQYDFHGRLDLVSFVKSVQRAGLYVNLRIGPYITAEWNYGGLPVWLRKIPGMAFRTDNQPFETEMQTFVTKIVGMMKAEKLFSWQGGPIILAQIENEFGLAQHGSADIKYMLWAAHMAEAQNIGVPWTMCQQANAPNFIINTCNGFYCDWFRPNNISKPTMWTENWTGWFHKFGASIPHRPVEDIAFAAARFFEKGGSFLNYYMYFGGTNFGRTASGPFLGTSYDYDAPIDEYGLFHQPKWGHLNDLHRAVKLCEPVMILTNPVYRYLGTNLEAHIYQAPGKTNQRSSALCCAFVANVDTSQNANVTFNGNNVSLPAWSVSILPDCQNVAFNSAQVVAQTSVPAMRPSIEPNSIKSWESYQEPVGLWGNITISANNLLEQINTTLDGSDYLWYTTSVNIIAEDLQGEVQQQLTISSTRDALQIYINGNFSGNHTFAKSSLSVNQSIKLIIGHNEIALLSMTVGLQDYGYRYDRVSAGLSGSINLKGLRSGDKELATQQWRYQVGLKGEALKIYTQEGANSILWTSELQAPWTQYLTWYKTSFATPSGSDPVSIYLGSMGKGQAWVNGNNLGRFWPSLLISETDCSQTCDYRGKFTPKKCRTDCGQQSQQWYHIPREWLQPNQNLLVVFDELGGDVSKIYVATKTVATICVHVLESYPPQLDSWSQFQAQPKVQPMLLTPEARLECQDNQVISSINFASFGNPQGNCKAFHQGNCHAKNSVEVVKEACIGKQTCSILVSSATFDTEPCAGISKSLAIKAQCQAISSTSLKTKLEI